MGDLLVLDIRKCLYYLGEITGLGSLIEFNKISLKILSFFVGLIYFDYEPGVKYLLYFLHHTGHNRILFDLVLRNYLYIQW